MAIIPYAITPLPEPGDPVAWVASWGPMADGDVGQELPAMWSYADRSFQVEGTFGAGGSCSLEGSNDLANYRILNDPTGVALTITSAAIKAVIEVTQNIRPHVTAGDGTTELTVTMLLRRTTPRL